MCDTCGCDNPGGFTVDGKSAVPEPAPHFHFHGSHGHSHAHAHGDGHTHAHGETIDLNLNILAENTRLAERNRATFAAKGILALNMVSSPGSGKTTILEKTIRALLPERKMAVIEGDQQTSRDADRIKGSGAPAVQVNTGSGCHLDARMVQAALQPLALEENTVLFIENVGNLVCPALFDLGERRRVVVISVTEGDDKPLKYPYMFQTSDLCLINKIDLLPYVDFNVERAMGFARQFKPDLKFISLSARTGEGMEEWFGWLRGEWGTLSGSTTPSGSLP